MIRQTLGIQAPQDHVASATSTMIGMLGVTAGAAVSGYANGRFPAAGRDHVAVKIPFTDRVVPADLAGVLALHFLGAFVLDDYAEVAHDVANGVLGQYVGRVATRVGSEHRLVAQLPGGAAAKQLGGASVSAAQRELAGLVEIAGARARKYKMAG